MKRSALRIGKGQCRHVHVCTWGIINLNHIQTIHGLMWIDSSLAVECLFCESLVRWLSFTLGVGNR